MKITKQQLRRIIEEEINKINETDMTNTPPIQELIRQAENEVRMGNLFPEDIDDIKSMARGGYNAFEIRKHKNLRF